MDPAVPDILYYAIVSNQQIKTPAKDAPINKAEFMNCSMLDKTKNIKYGERIVEAIRAFLKVNNRWGGVDADRKTEDVWSPAKKSENSSNRGVNSSMRRDATDLYDMGIDFDQM
ncbi:hypothetical protein TrLO_g4720 [Triparma laevis f. longispina]|uniref:Uncharacterized protein n=1 Tax=Triparma laevis f. longispina TaxID=1714387 RepID=A0A9W7FB65_9STRA|nr:hypothetical protein TrLO_g4720 [Triparma laevis f. longispina]